MSAAREPARDLSLWLDTMPGSLAPRPALAADTDVDVAIIGAGYTGLWTAYYLTEADPTLRIAVVEKEIAGFGGSGRNGGWCSALFAASWRKLEKAAGRSGLVAQQRAMFDTVDEVGRVAAREGIDIHYAKGGTLEVARSAPQEARLRAHVVEAQALGFGDDYCWLDKTATDERIRTTDSRGAAYTPHCAAIHPARLARGLADVVERRGVTVYEQSPVVEIGDRSLRTPGGRLRAEVVVRATEAFTATLPGLRRAVAPVYSLVIATEPLPDAVWAQIGWARREAYSDGRHLLVYAQRTADGRIAFGGRGAPYHFGSRVDSRFDRNPGVFAHLRAALRELWPAAGDAAITHEWGGAVAVPRDWFSSVGYDRRSGLAWAGGYVGDGVGTTNLAGRTLADLITGRHTDLTRLPWVGHHSRRWEPEPLRWLGVNAGVVVMSSADRAERRTGKPARRADLINRLMGG